MIDILLLHVFHPKIIYHQGETDRSGFMPPKSGCVDTLVITEWCQLSVEALVCKNPCLYCSPTYGMRIHEACRSGLAYPIT